MPLTTLCSPSSSPCGSHSSGSPPSATPRAPRQRASAQHNMLWFALSPAKSVEHNSAPWYAAAGQSTEVRTTAYVAKSADQVTKKLHGCLGVSASISIYTSCTSLWKFGCLPYFVRLLCDRLSNFLRKHGEAMPPINSGDATDMKQKL